MSAEITRLPESIDLQTPESVSNQVVDASLKLRDQESGDKVNIVENVTKYWTETVPGAFPAHKQSRPDGYYAPVDHDYMGTAWDARGLAATGALLGSPYGKKGMLIGLAPAALSVIEGESMRQNPYEFGTIHKVTTGITDIASYSLTSGAWNFGQDAAETIGVERGSVDSMFISAGAVGTAIWGTVLTLFKGIPALKNKLFPGREARIEKSSLFKDKEVKLLDKAFKENTLGDLEKGLRKSKGIFGKSMASILGVGFLRDALKGRDAAQLRNIPLSSADFESTRKAINTGSPNIGAIRGQVASDLQKLLQKPGNSGRAGAPDLAVDIKKFQSSTTQINQAQTLINSIRGKDKPGKVSLDIERPGNGGILNITDIAPRKFVPSKTSPGSINQRNIMDKFAGTRSLSGTVSGGAKFKGKENGVSDTFRLVFADNELWIQKGKKPCRNYKNYFWERCSIGVGIKGSNIKTRFKFVVFVLKNWL